LGVFLEASFKYKNIKIGLMSVYAVIIQFYGYGKGFLQSHIQVNMLNKEPQKVFPNLFFN